MHIRNPYYENPPNFSELAANFEEFRRCCPLGRNGKPIVDFQKDEVVRTLAKVLLWKDFQLKVDIPAGYLVPRIPQRVNYLLWVEDILNLNGINKNVVGIDIGTGASCVYALIGAKKFGWRLIATDSDEKAVSTAQDNVRVNGLDTKISVVRVQSHSILQDVVANNTDATFCMCNPPFYESDELIKLYVPTDAGFSNCTTSETRQPPHSVTLARKNELEVEGGEVSFVSHMITESVSLASKVRFYSSMLGKKASLLYLKKLFASIEGVRYSVSTLIQGKTQRWIIAWTFDDEIILEEPSRGLTVRLQCTNETDAIGFIENELNILNITVARISGRNNLKCDAIRCTWRCKRRKSAITDLPSKQKRHSLDNSHPLRQSDIEEETSSTRNGTIHFQVRIDVDSNRLNFDFIRGNKQLLCQIVQYFKNKFEK